MQAQDIRQIAEWLAATDIDMLELRGPGVEVQIHRHGAPPGDAGPDPEPAAATNHIAVRAPSVGVLLDRIPGRMAPLSSPGTAVVPGSLLALLQIGPLLLPVRAPCSGRVVEWLAPPGEPVGYGTPLIHIGIEPAAAPAA